MIFALGSKQAVASVVACAFAVLGSEMATAQQIHSPSAAAPASPANGCAPPTNWTAEQDHQNMMDQLGIKALRPGPSGNEKAPNHANYDESKANPFRICPMRSP